MHFIQRNQIVDLDKLFNGYYQACINTRSQAKALKTEYHFGKLIRRWLADANCSQIKTSQGQTT